MFIILTFQPLQVNNILLTLWNFGYFNVRGKDLINHHALSLVMLWFILWISFVIKLNVLKESQKTNWQRTYFLNKCAPFNNVFFSCRYYCSSGVRCSPGNHQLGDKWWKTKTLQNMSPILESNPWFSKIQFSFFKRESGKSRWFFF